MNITNNIMNNYITNEHYEQLSLNMLLKLWKKGIFI